MSWNEEDDRKFLAEFEGIGGIRGVESILGEESLNLSELNFLAEFVPQPESISAGVFLADLATGYFRDRKEKENDKLDYRRERAIKALIGLRESGLIYLDDSVSKLREVIQARRRSLRPVGPKKTT